VLRAAGWPARFLLLGLVRGYQLTLSGLLGGHCRFDPTCSVYAAGAIRARGAVVGSALAIYRVVRCNPFSRGGADPAPSRSEYEHVIQGSTG
jgi:putative membrane protein insertion efficiency factor